MILKLQSKNVASIINMAQKWINEQTNVGAIQNKAQRDIKTDRQAGTEWVRQIYRMGVIIITKSEETTFYLGE